MTLDPGLRPPPPLAKRLNRDALTVAAVGLAGLVSYSIHRRRAEIGIRAALGASPGSLVWLVMREPSGAIG